MQAQCEAYQTMQNSIGATLSVIIGLSGLIAVIFVAVVFVPAAATTVA